MGTEETEEWSGRSVKVWVIITLAVVAVSQGPVANSQTTMAPTPQAFTEGTEYHDLTFGRRLMLGAASLVNPDGIQGIDIGYKNPVTITNRVELCDRARRDDGLMGLVLETGTILVPTDMVRLCESGRVLPNRLVFIDPENGDPVISWNAYPRGR